MFNYVNSWRPYGKGTKEEKGLLNAGASPKGQAKKNCKEETFQSTRMGLGVTYSNPTTPIMVRS